MKNLILVMVTNHAIINFILIILFIIGINYLVMKLITSKRQKSEYIDDDLDDETDLQRAKPYIDIENKYHNPRRRVGRIRLLREITYCQCEKWNKKHEIELIDAKEQSAFDWAYDKLPDTEAMYLSGKEIKIQSWLTDDEIIKLRS